MTRIRSALILIIFCFILGPFFSYGQDNCLYGTVAIEYIVKGKPVTTPLKGVQVVLTSAVDKQIVSRTITFENGYFYLANLTESTYELTFTFGKELLTIEKCYRGRVAEEIKKSVYRFAYSPDSKNLGSFIIGKDTIQSMRL